MKSSWKQLLNELNAFDLAQKIYEDNQLKKIYPDYQNVFHCFDFFEIKETKIVILGQDPYHQPAQAMGLAFSVPDNVKIPPSLKNIFKELFNDLGIEKKSGNLEGWAKQGILLLNAVLTVEDSKPNSHKNYGWQTISDEIIKKVNQTCPHAIFVFLGKVAQQKANLLQLNTSTIISSHPSPLGCHQGFLGSKIFSKINVIMEKKQMEKINW